MISAKLKIALLYDVWNEDPVAAAAKEKEDEPPARKTRRKKTKKKRKEMTDREEIFEALAKLGHEPSYIELDGRPQSLHSLARCDADLIFNLTESFDGDDTKEMNVVAYVDLLGIPYTGRQSDCQKDFCLSRHQDPVLCHCLSWTHRARARHFLSAYRQAGPGGWLHRN